MQARRAARELAFILFSQFDKKIQTIKRRPARYYLEISKNINKQCK